MVMDGFYAVGLPVYILGANIHYSGAVPAGAVVSVYGAHLQKQASVDLPATADVVPSTHSSLVAMTAQS